MTNWDKVKLGRLLTESRIESGNPDTSRRIRVKLNVSGVEKRPETNDKEGATKYFIRKKGQFIYGRQNLHKGAFGIVPEELDGFESSSDIPAFDVDNSCYPEWIYYFFKQGNFYLSLESLAKGVGSKRIHPEQLFEISIPLPPQETQKAIIEKIQTFEKNYATVVEENGAQLSLLTALRQAILTEAVQGKLTAQWRRDNPNQEHAAELLKRIAAEKARLIKEKKIGKEKPLPPIKMEDVPYEVPEGWVWCRLGKVLQSLRYGTSKKCDYGLGDSPVLRIPNLVNGKIDLTDLKSTNLTTSEKNDLAVKTNDLMIIRSNGSKSLVGRSAVVTDKIDGYSFAGYLIRARPINGINSNFIFNVFESPFLRNLIEGPLRTTSGVKNINSQEVNRLPIPLPPPPEQHVIVQKVNTLLAYCDELEQRVRQSKADLDLLMQAVLGEVFGAENQAIEKKANKTRLSEKETLMSNNITQPIYEGNTLNMELLEILQQQPSGKIAAVNLWKMSKYQKDIDAFYEALKREVEEKKTIKEADEKGWLELISS